MAEFIVPEGADSVRCSSLPTWSDCERRWMATQRRRLLVGIGHRLQERPPSVGLHVGSASHAGLARGWQGFEQHGSWTPLDECTDLAVEQLREATNGGNVAWDKTSPDLNAAEGATVKIMKAYRADVRPERRPALIEHSMGGRVSRSFYLTGHCDLYTEPDLVLEDYKTGVRVPTPERQIGGYTLTLMANKRPVNRARMTFLRRVGRKTEQPPPMSIAYDPKLSAYLARQTLDEIDAKLTAFRTASTPSPFIFRSNTSSVLCGAKYCPAFGSHTWCPESVAKAQAAQPSED